MKTPIQILDEAIATLNANLAANNAEISTLQQSKQAASDRIDTLKADNATTNQLLNRFSNDRTAITTVTPA